MHTTLWLALLAGCHCGQFSMETDYVWVHDDGRETPYATDNA